MIDINANNNHNNATAPVAGTDYDQIQVTGTPGTATLAGTATINQNGGEFVNGSVYHILTTQASTTGATDGLITGSFNFVGTVISPFITLPAERDRRDQQQRHDPFGRLYADGGSLELQHGGAELEPGGGGRPDRELGPAGSGGCQQRDRAGAAARQYVGGASAKLLRPDQPGSLRRLCHGAAGPR